MEDTYCWDSDPANLDQVVAIMQKYAKVPELSAEQYKAMVKRLIPVYGPAIDSRTIDTWAHLVVDQKQVKTLKTRADVIASVAPETYSCKK